MKSDYFLNNLFNILKKSKSLEIMKYNKKLQKRLKLRINDYKEYSQLFSSKEIELKIDKYGKNKFINILEKEKEFYHIYFNNSNDEIKRDYLKKMRKLKQ